LRKLGYAVLEAANGAEALKLWEQHQQSIELLLTDMVMSEGLNGLELAERLKATKAALKIIVSSGYSADLVAPQPLGQGMAFLAKPFRPSALAKLVRQCLDST
jgi:CheY-like chemotaxis protein